MKLKNAAGAESPRRDDKSQRALRMRLRHASDYGAATSWGDTNGRYEVEVQLGSTDESHIIRTIEYWDIERKRYPQYDHTAVIVAEDITSRCLNVISLIRPA